MTDHFDNLTRDRAAQKVLLGARLTKAELQSLLEAHARFRAGRPDGVRAVMLRCDLSGLDLPGVDLSGADLLECDFTGCNLTGARFNDATLSGCRFTDSLLNAAHFAGANLSRANFAMADLRGADFTAAQLVDARLETALVGTSPETGLPTNIDTRILDRALSRRRRH